MATPFVMTPAFERATARLVLEGIKPSDGPHYRAHDQLPIRAFTSHHVPPRSSHQRTQNSTMNAVGLSVLLGHTLPRNKGKRIAVPVEGGAWVPQYWRTGRLAYYRFDKATPPAEGATGGAQ